MNTIDPMVSALIALCKTEGGERFVADKAVVSAENLLQITKGVKLPSGNPRGVGPGLRAKITRAYPNWLDATPRAANPIGVQAEPRSGNTSSSDILDNLAAKLAQLDPTKRIAAGGLLSALAQQPNDPALMAALTALLEPAAFTEKVRKAA